MFSSYYIAVYCCRFILWCNDLYLYFWIKHSNRMHFWARANWGERKTRKFIEYPLFIDAKSLIRRLVKSEKNSFMQPELDFLEVVQNVSYRVFWSPSLARSFTNCKSWLWPLLAASWLWLGSLPFVVVSRNSRPGQDWPQVPFVANPPR